VKETIESPSTCQRLLKETEAVELVVEEVGAPKIHTEDGLFGDIANFGGAIQRQTGNCANTWLAHPSFLRLHPTRRGSRWSY